MKALFNRITALALRFRVVTLILALLISVAGVIAATQFKQELIPPIAFPQTIILAQASGMTSEQILTVLTDRLEAALGDVPEIVNVESQSTGAFGAVITARNDFGQNQTRIRETIQTAFDGVWLPLRRIAPPEGVSGDEYAAGLLSELSPDVLIYIAERDPNFLFQLTPEVWGALSDEAARPLLAYLAAQTREDAAGDNALSRLVERQVIPALDNVSFVASVSVSGGQLLPGESGALPEGDSAEDSTSPSLLLQLSTESWAVASAKAGLANTTREAGVATLAAEAPAVPQTPPALPASWQGDRFKDATDLLEMRTLTRTVGATINTFRDTGEIVGALGQTDDLTPDTVAQMLAIEPTMLQYFDAEQLAAFPDEVYAALPADFIAGLDGFTRDALAAKALAAALTGEQAAPTPVDLPSPWRIQPPQLITFSFDDLPLATFSISADAEGTAAIAAAPLAEATEVPAADAGSTATPGAETTTTADPVTTDAAGQAIPEGPGLPFTFGFVGIFLGTELDTADDLIPLQLSEDLAAQFGATTIDAATFFNFLILLGNPEALPEGVAAPSLPVDPQDLIGQISPEVFTFLAENDPAFLSTLTSDVYTAFSDRVLALPQAAPPLGEAWGTLAEQPQFADQPLATARDLIALGGASASSVLNALNANVPEAFAGSEVRLFDALSPAALRVFALNEADFYTQLDPLVLTKLSPTTLAALSDDVIAALPAETAATVRAIAAGDQPSAAAALSALYATNAPPADPNAPVINADWQVIGDFLGIELDSADDFFRSPEAIGASASGFINSLFNSAAGANFAPGLLGGISAEALDYLNGREPGFYDQLSLDALRLLTPEVLAALPPAVGERVTSGELPFEATDVVTRIDGSSSVFLTVYKTRDSNTIEAYHAAEDVLEDLEASGLPIRVGVSFEQASFIEESISGVTREGLLGAIFAIVVILVFLSGGPTWGRRPRAIVGAILIAFFAALLILLVSNNLDAAGGDFGAAFNLTDVVFRVLLIGGIVVGVLVFVWPGRLPNPAWRSTLVTAISIPLSVLMALAIMRWILPAINGALAPAAEGSSFIAFILRIFPANLTINIMTLSGLTVAIGRVVDDSIVVLENIFRQVQEGGDRKTAILHGTRDVSVAIFAATVITVVVFLPLGLTGGIIGEFFLPFGLAVTYSLLASFIVAITIVPVVAYFLLDPSEMGEEKQSWIERIYVPVLQWSLFPAWHRLVILAIAAASLVIGGVLFAGRPQAFLPAFGEPQIGVSVSMPTGTRILETNARVVEFETALRAELPEGAISRTQTIVGGSGASFESLLTGGGGVEEGIASITLGIEDQDELDALAGEVRALAERVFGEGNASVSAASLSEQGLGGFALVLAGPREDLEAINDEVIAALNEVPGLANVTSNLSGLAGGAAQTYIRIDGQTAVEYGGELETNDTLGVTDAAKTAILALPNLPDTIIVSEGFETELQTQGFANLFVAMGIAIAIVVVILIITFGSLVHWLDIILSIAVAPVGAAILLTLTNRVLGISALIGLLMLIGIVVTNAVVLIDRVNSNRRERGMNVRDALVEAGDRRLRPILMTALATIFALMPLALGLSEGAIIASELGTVVIGGLFSSTLLTLLVVPVAYILLDPLNRAISRLFGRRDTPTG